MAALDDYMRALGSIESSNNYAALGPATRNGDRAYGRYQVMGNNVPAWTQAALGRSLSPDEFLRDPQAQDAVFRHRFGGYVNQYGNPQDAASMWFSGRPLNKAGNSDDGYITTPEYVRRFNTALGAPTDISAASRTPHMDPNQSPMQAAMFAAAPPMQQAMQQPQQAPAGGALNTVGDTLQRMGMWAMAANNPSVLGALGQTNPQRKFVPIGTDEFGNPKYGWVDPRAGTVTPVGGATGGDTNGISAAIGEGLTGKDLLNDKRIPAVIRSNAYGLIAGTRPWNPNPRDAMAKMTNAVAQAAAPGEDLSGRMAAAKDWATKQAELGRRMNQAAMHTSEMPQNFEDMNNTSSPLVNSVKNSVGENVFGWGAPTKLRSNINQAATELANFTGGGTISDKRFDEWAKGFPINGSPEQQRAAMKIGASLFEDSIDAYRQKHKQAFGSFAEDREKQYGPVVPQRTLDAVARMKAYANSDPNASSGAQAPTISNIRQIN